MDGVVTLLPDNHSTGDGTHAHHGVTQHPEAGYEDATPAAHHFPHKSNQRCPLQSWRPVQYRLGNTGVKHSYQYQKVVNFGGHRVKM